MVIQLYNPQSRTISFFNPVPEVVINPTDNRQTIIGVTLVPLEDTNAWNMEREQRLIELSQKIKALVNPERLPSVFSMNIEAFSQAYANFNEGYTEILQIVDTEVRRDISEAIIRTEDPLSEDLRREAQQLLDNNVLDILKASKIRYVIHPDFLEFLNTNHQKLRILGQYSKQLEHIQKVLGERGQSEESIEKAIADLKWIKCRSTALYIAALCFSGIGIGGTIAGIYFGATARTH